MEWHDIHKNFRYFHPRQKIELGISNYCRFLINYIKSEPNNQDKCNHQWWYKYHILILFKNFLPVLIDITNERKVTIVFHSQNFDTIYYVWTKWWFKSFDNLLSMVYMLSQSWMCHIDNMKLKYFFIIPWIPCNLLCHVFQCKLILMLCYQYF